MIIKVTYFICNLVIFLMIFYGIEFFTSKNIYADDNLSPTDVDINWYVVSSGGSNHIQSGFFILSGSTCQTVVGTSSSGSLKVNHGFWQDFNFYDSDIDDDEIPDSIDNCPTVYNPLQEDTELDGIGDSCDNCIYCNNPLQENGNSEINNIGDSCENCCDAEPSFGLTGNVNCSECEGPDISDITRLIDYLYLSHEPLCCPKEADVDVSGGEPDISDITYLIDHLYLSHKSLPLCQ